MCEQGAHRVQRVTLHRLDHLDVGARGHRDRAVAQDPLHRRCLHAHREEQGGAGVPQVMHAKLRHVGDLAQAMEHPVDIARLDEAADCGGEHQAGVAPLRAGGEPFFELPFVNPDEKSTPMRISPPSMANAAMSFAMPLVALCAELSSRLRSRKWLSSRSRSRSPPRPLAKSSVAIRDLGLL